MEELERVSCIGFASISCISLASVTFVRPHKYHSLFVGCAGFILVFFCAQQVRGADKKKSYKKMKMRMKLTQKILLLAYPCGTKFVWTSPRVSPVSW